MFVNKKNYEKILGKKNLLGFYSYSSGKPIPDISSVKSIIEEAKLKNESKNIVKYFFLLLH